MYNRNDDTVSMGMSGGPLMEGTWYNPSTGDSFTVRDTYFEGDQLYVIAMDGRRYNGDMLDSYVQADGPLPPKPEIDPNQEQIGGALLQGLDAEMQSEISGLLGASSQAVPADPLNQIIGPQPTTTAASQSNQPVDEDELLLRRMLSKVELPKIKCDVKWNKFPSKQLEMLEMLGVEEEKVIDFILNKIDMNDIRKAVSQSLAKSIKDHADKNEK